MIRPAQGPLSVSELNEYARKLLAGDPLLRSVEVTGEISGYKCHYSGHRYFFLKDADARVQCVMFRQNAQSLDFQPADGMKVTLTAAASLFVRDGSYQLYVSSMHRSGLGDLYVRFEQLKARLASEGLFDPARKRQIPYFPQTIGIATSETGAAVRDMIRIARRRNPNVGILISPCAVQGASAVSEIVRAIRTLNASGRCDVLLVGRGGGSIEDLWAFNEEAVARAIAESHIPVISCVGHEVDFTIADFVADLRAPTPSAAAELAVPVVAELHNALDALHDRLAHALLRGQAVRKANLAALTASAAISLPKRILLDNRQKGLDQLGMRLVSATELQMERGKRRLDSAAGRLSSLNPKSVLDRGYAIIKKESRIIDSLSELRHGDTIELTMSGGFASVNVTDIKAGEEIGKEKTDI